MNQLSPAQRQALFSIYTDPKHPAAFSSAARLYEAAQKASIKVPLRVVKDFIQSLEVYQKFRKQSSLRFPRRKSRFYSLNSDWFVDLFWMSRDAARFNRGYSVILIAIDGFSRFTMASVLKAKDAKSVLEGLKTICVNRGALPSRLIADRGTEFTNALMKEFCEENGIQMVYLRPPLKSYLSELAGKNLKSRLTRYLYFNDTNVWYDQVQDAVTALNARVRKKIGLAPVEINASNQSEVYERLYRPVGMRNAEKPPKLKVNDPVRLRLYRTSAKTFEKSYKPGWSDEIFLVAKVNCRRDPCTYTLKDINGTRVSRYTYYTQELQRIRLNV